RPPISTLFPYTTLFRSDVVEKVIDINLMGAVNSIAAVMPEMLELGSGHLVAISSLAGFRGLPRSAAYSASKAAMTAYFESIRLEDRKSTRLNSSHVKIS